jgi:hypothetical protein
MTTKGSRTTAVGESAGETGLSTYHSGGMMGLGIELEECDPISTREFRVLMVLVVSATLAFGCIVNGWLM